MIDKIDREEVLRIYDLAHLELDEERLDILTKKYSKVLEFAELIMEVDTDNVQAMEIAQENKAVFREDVPIESPDRELVLSNAKDREYGYFRLKKVIE